MLSAGALSLGAEQWGADTVLQLGAALAAEIGGLALCRLCRFTALAESLLHLLHIRGGEHIAAALAGLIGQLVVDGDDVLQQQDGHHHQFIAEADRNGPQDDDQQTIAAHPDAVAGPVVVLGAEEHEHAEDDNGGGGEDVQGLKDLFHHQVLEVAGIVEELAKGAQLFPLLLRDHIDEGQDSGDEGQDTGDNEHGGRHHNSLSFLYVISSIYRETGLLSRQKRPAARAAGCFVFSVDQLLSSGRGRRYSWAFSSPFRTRRAPWARASSSSSPG